MSEPFSVVAIVAAYNEADIIDQVVRDLIAQGVQVYFLDDGSTDDTVAIVERYVGRGVMAVERLPAVGQDGKYAWERILRRKAELADSLEADWFIHHDADEFRESPWPVTLLQAIQHVDSLGFNAIDFAGFDFWPDHDGFRPGDDVRETLLFYADAAPYDRVQIRAWKKTAGVDLASSGGHEARFPGRKVFPLRFILRHYPVRGQRHGERKVFRERRDRFPDAERKRGWHCQYGQREGDSFIRDRPTLRRYDADAVRVQLALRHRDAEAFGAEVERQAEAIESYRRDLNRLTAECERRVAELDALRLEMERLQASARAELASAHASIAARDADLASARALTAARDADVATLQGIGRQQRDDLERLMGNVSDLEHALEDRMRQIDALLASFSWRWTAPARAVYRALRGR